MGCYLLSWLELRARALQCSSKSDWEKLFSIPIDWEQGLPTSHDVKNIFSRLSQDPCSKRYAVSIWVNILKVSRLTWDSDLSKEIVAFCHTIVSTQLQLEIAFLYLDLGRTSEANAVVRRGLKFKGLSTTTHTQFQNMLAITHAKERLRPTADLGQKIFSHFDALTFLSPEAFTIMARTAFSAGNYKCAAKYFDKASHGYRLDQNIMLECSSLFNSGACYDNLVLGKPKNAYSRFAEQRVAEAATKAKANSLKGVLAACEGFFGMRHLSEGKADASIAFFQKALRLRPSQDKSVRTLHWLSSLTDAYRMAGHKNHALSTWKKTQALLDGREPTLYKCRLVRLESQLLWDQGHLPTAHAVLTGQLPTLMRNEPHTLEKVTLAAEYLRQCALLSERPLPRFLAATRTSDIFAKDATFCESLSLWRLTTGNFTEASDCLAPWTHSAFSEKFRYLSELLTVPRTQNEHPVDAHFVGLSHGHPFDQNPKTAWSQAAAHYHSGDLTSCLRLLKQAGNSASGEARAVGLSWANFQPDPSWQKVIHTWTRLYFHPSITQCGDKVYCVSGHYNVDLTAAPLAHSLLMFLSTRPDTTFEELLKQVWGVSPQVKGGRERILRVLERLCEAFSATLVPIVSEKNGRIALARDAIHFKMTSEPIKDVNKIIGDNSLTSLAIARQLGVSHATARRIVSQSINNGILMSRRKGRNILYSKVDPTHG